jgi:membrane protease YdiL (CAAX protease family)
LEEILFRGGIFGALRKNMPWKAALVISSSIYALVHFLGSPRDNGPIVWYSGLALLPGMLDGFFHINQLIPGFFNLTLAGSLLALAYHRTGNLYFSIGLHSGWIFWLKSNGVLTREVPGANAWLWGGNKLIDGWFALLVLSATLACFSYLAFPRSPRREISAEP